MEDKVKRVLFVDSEMFPFLPESPIATISRYLPQGTVDLRKDVRSFVPRYGLINERKNSLHEVIRLSGMNIVIDKVDRPLIIKVTSISAARMQIYFIDNDDFFKRKALYHDAQGRFFKDNEERAIFFARGVLETVKKLRWSPDIIHCNGWISHILPLYLKKRYAVDPIFAGSKVVVSLYNDLENVKFAKDFQDRILFDNITKEDIPDFNEPTNLSLSRLAMNYADGVILGESNIPAELVDFAKSKELPVLDFSQSALDDGSYISQYNDFYEKIF